MMLLQRVLLVSYLAIALLIAFSTAAGAESLPNTNDIFSAGLDNLRQHNYPQALTHFTQVIDRQDILMGAAYSNRCLVNLQLHNDLDSIADCTLAIDKNAHNAEAYLNLGLAYYHQGKYQAAIAKYNRVIQLNSEDYRAYYNRGLSASALSNYQEAIADYQTALTYSPDSAVKSKSLIYNDLALAQMMVAENAPALSHFDLAIALNENNYHAYYNRGCVYHRQGKHQAAIEDFSEVLRLQPDFTQAYVHRGILKHQIGARDLAYKDLKLALQQYRDRGDSDRYNSVMRLQHHLFYAQPNSLV